MKILAFGDAQLGAHDRLDDQADVLARIAHLAVERQVGLVLNGGDTFEGGEIRPEQLRVFADFVAEMRAHSIPVLTVLGNGRHDRHRSVDGVSIFNEIPGAQVAATPDVYAFEGCTVAAMPWVSPAWLQAHFGSAASRDEVNAHMADVLVERIARDLLTDCRQVGTHLPAVLLTHFAISGASLPTGLPVDLMKEPVLSLPDLEALGFDAVVASHIHRGQLLSSEPPVFFTGSPMAHDFGEAGFEHGVWLLEFVDGGTRVSFEAVESRPLLTLDIDPDDLVDPDAAWCPEDVDGAIVRLRYAPTVEQQRRIDVNAVRAQLHASGAHAVKVVPEIVRADRARVEGLDDQVGDLDALDAWLNATSYDGDRERLRSRAALYLEVG